MNRCLFRSNTAGYTIDKIEFTNCIIRDCGSNTYNLVYPKHAVKEVITTNCTLYNYTNGESFFFANAAAPDNVLNFTFENNTVYKWAKSNDRALCKTEGKYNANSTYHFRNNIITVPGVAGTKPQIVQTTSGTVIGENNLIVDYGGYTGGTQDISDLKLAEFGLASIGFLNPDNGDFTLLSTSPLATAGTGGKCVGDPRWVDATTAIAPVKALNHLLSVVYNANSHQLTVSAEDRIESIQIYNTVGQLIATKICHTTSASLNIFSQEQILIIKAVMADKNIQIAKIVIK